ncbi:NUDIX domain-containing protein [Sphingomonas sp. BIUV-7]|uniref:NUDIX domain-containing protein n=1 Tax=Sphingomonas natans TaxID=3063330 RepID=A0ABT8Y5V0_9SPHN|nr:NUDIX domain-containing protein [Sphingomonas sp. BIUV-7]MDO6413695.1 NUDIX domain-containing protein [Sphingomonas sp. BIUV-7]
MSDAAPHLAATLIVMRDRAEAPPELLMIQRSATMRFGPEAWVFPGGRIDPGDVSLAASRLPPGADPDDHAARIAAIRETIEEAGVPIGLDPVPDPATLAALRAALHAGEAFATLLDRFGLRLLPEALHPFSRWWPPESAPRRFDTRFYLARAPDEAVLDADGGETVAICWTAAEAMLARPDARILFPTRCNLHRLAAWSDFSEAVADAAAYPAATIVSELIEIGEERFVYIPEGHGYPETRLDLAKALRD